MSPAARHAAEAFRALHLAPDLIILPNAWDAVSARVLAEAGAKAVATSSAAVAWSHGYADGDHLPPMRLVATLEAIVRVLPVPLTADLESGYADKLDDFREFVRWVVGAGVAGINLEDQAGSCGLLCAKIEAARAAAAAEGVPLFVNARTDVLLKGTHVGEAGVAEALRRGGLYRSAGADGFFVPTLVDEAQIKAVVEGVPLPLNLMVWPGMPTGARLRELGVKRISSATWPARAALDALRQAASAYLATGDSEPLIAAAGPRLDYNAWFKR